MSPQADITIAVLAGLATVGIVAGILINELVDRHYRLTPEQIMERMAELLKGTRYPQFPNEEDCNQRLRLLEITKDRRIETVTKRCEGLDREAATLRARDEVRARVHRDDYLRSGYLIAGLLAIIRLGDPAAIKLAEEALNLAWGVTKPQGHCAKHARYHPNCPDCVGLGQAPVPELSEDGEK